MSIKQDFSNRRNYYRVRLSPLLIEPIQITIPDVKTDSSIPGVIADMSAKGIAFLTYINIPAGTIVNLNFELLGLKIKNLKGRVHEVRSHHKTYVLVILFDKIQNAIASEIENIAMDYEDCEIKWKRGDRKICFKSCKYYPFCSKSIKI